MKEANPLWLLIPAGLVLLLAAVVLIPPLFEGPPSECSPEVISLSPPNNTSLLIDAVEQLVEARIVPDAEAAISALAASQYVFDPDEDWQLEYWLIFDSGGAATAAEFNFHCALDEENVPLDLEYEGSRQLD